MKKISLLILLILLTTSCSQEEKQKVQKYYETEIVKTWSINNINTFIWTTSWQTEINLSTKSPWKIVFLWKNIWDKVEKWELIANLDSSEAKVWYSTASNISNTLYSLKNSTNISLNNQIEATKEKINQAKLWIKWLEEAIINTTKVSDQNIEIINSKIIQAKIWIETAKLNYNKTKNVLEWNKINIIKNAKNAVTQSLILDTNVINFVDELLWITKENKRKNDDFEDYLWVKKNNLNNETKILFKKINLNLEEYRLLYENKIENNSEINQEEIVKILEQWEKLALDIQELLKNTYDILTNSIANIKFTQATINNYKAQISTFANQIESSLITVEWEYILWLKWSIQNLDSIDRNTSKALNLLEKQIELAQEWLKTVENTKKTYITNKKINLDDLKIKKEVAKSSLEEVFKTLKTLESSKNATLKEIDTNITKVNWEKNLSAVMINNWKIISPISWIITNKFVEKWQVIWWWIPIYTISNNDNIKIKIDITNELANKLQINKKVKIEINNKIYNWKITNLPEVSKTINKRIPIEIIIDNSTNLIKVWETAKVYIENINTNSNSIIIPNNSIIEKFLIPWVYIIKNNIAVFKKIEILSSDDKYSEINWINIWDKLITKGKENIFDGEILK